MRTVTGHIPSPLPADLIYSLQSPTSLTPPYSPSSSVLRNQPPTPTPESPTITPSPLNQPNPDRTQLEHTLQISAPPPLSPPPLFTAAFPAPETLLMLPPPPQLPPVVPPPPPLPIPTAPPPTTDLPTRRSSRVSHPPNFWKGCYTLAPPPPPLPPTLSPMHNPTNAAQRKIFNARLAAIRNRQHRLDTLPSTPLNNRPTTLEPQPLPTHRPEMSIRKASLLLPNPNIEAGIQKELSEHFNTYESLKLISRSSVEPIAIFQPNAHQEEVQ